MAVTPLAVWGFAGAQGWLGPDVLPAQTAVQKPWKQKYGPPPQSAFVEHAEYMASGGHGVPPMVSQTAPAPVP